VIELIIFSNDYGSIAMMKHNGYLYYIVP